MTAPRNPRALLLAALGLLIPLGIFLGAGERGIDFGDHWDEKIHFGSTQTAILNQTLLPENYQYPSMCFWLSMATLAPYAPTAFEQYDGEELSVQVPLIEYVYENPYRLRFRRLLLALSSLSLLWVFLLVLSWRESALEAFFAAGFLGFSWEFGYHARWIAPDTLMMQFAALWLLFTVRAIRTPRRRWLLLAAVAAGLAAATKYPGGALLLPTFLLAARDHRAAGDRGLPWRRWGLLAACFAATFLAITPGAVLDPVRFWKYLSFELRHYQQGHFGYTVDAGWDHFWRALRYLVESGPSTWKPISYATSLLVLFGAVRVARESRALALVLVGVPLLFLVYFANQRVLFVRNTLVVLPFAAVLAARGAGDLVALARSTPARVATAAGVALLLGTNAVELVQAARTIGPDVKQRAVESLHAAMLEAPELRYYVSPAIEQEFRRASLDISTLELTRERAGADLLALRHGELLNKFGWPSNRPGQVVAHFGARDVNFDYYASWKGYRLLLVTPERADELERIAVERVRARQATQRAQQE